MCIAAFLVQFQHLVIFQYFLIPIIMLVYIVVADANIAVYTCSLNLPILFLYLLIGFIYHADKEIKFWLSDKT